MMSFFFIYNGRFYPEGTPVIKPDNHSFRYGDGLFETIKSSSGKLLLEEYHFQRLFDGLQILGFDLPGSFTPLFLKKEIIRLLKKNDPGKSARVRLVVFRGNGHLSTPEDHYPNYIIQSWPLPRAKHLNKGGLIIDLYHQAKKSCDAISNLKTNSFLPYTLAGMNAKRNYLDDCILLNSNDRICDTSIANIFIIKDKHVFTPPLSEGCIAGVMRRWILENITPGSNCIVEKPLCISDLKQADEIFLSNSIHMIQWVRQFQDVTYSNIMVQVIYDELVQTFRAKYCL